MTDCRPVGASYLRGFFAMLIRDARKRKMEGYGWWERLVKAHRIGTCCATITARRPVLMGWMGRKTAEAIETQE